MSFLDRRIAAWNVLRVPWPTLKIPEVIGHDCILDFVLLYEISGNLPTTMGTHMSLIFLDLFHP